jgi:L-lysine 2,3-aminomutase
MVEPCHSFRPVASRWRPFHEKPRNKYDDKNVTIKTIICREAISSINPTTELLALLLLFEYIQSEVKYETVSAYRENSLLKNHPCFSVGAHKKFGRIHLPVAPMCNIQCKYCIRKYDCANESRPGITSKVMTPAEAMERVTAVVERNDNISVVGIAGPGDPLANEATFETLSLIHRAFPDLILCVSTNGLYLTRKSKAHEVRSEEPSRLR